MDTRTLIDQTHRILQAADQAGIRLRLLGGLAVRLCCPSAEQHPALVRSYADIDFAGLERESRAIKTTFRNLGYPPDERFNALHGLTRLIFYDPDGQSHVDIFLDRFVMCHSLDLRSRLLPGMQTLTPADLLVTKLQIIEANAKDMQDILALLLDHEPTPADTPETIGLDYLARLCAADWGLFTTFTDSLERVSLTAPEFLQQEAAAIISTRVKAIRQALETAPKTLGWRVRARIGRRMEWYDLPDEVNR